MTTIRTILVPVDFTPGSLAAVRYARDLAAIFSSKVHLLHVASGAPVWAAELFAAGLHPHRDHHQLDALDQIATLIASLRFDPRTTMGVVRMGCAEQSISSYAAEIRADLIVMGTHGDHRAETPGVGRVVERVLSRVSCPVLAIPDGSLLEAPIRDVPESLVEAVAC